MSNVSPRRCFITNVEPGARLAKAIIREDGYVVLSEGAVLTQGLLDRLYRMNISYVDIEFETPRESPIYVENMSGQEWFTAVYHDTVSDIKTAFSTMRYFKEVPLCQMTELAEARITPLIEAKGTISFLQTIRRRDEYTYYHSINVAIIAGILGKWAGYTGNELKNLILAGLLHDVGKTQIPLEILNKPGRLLPDEMEIMQMHAIYGYKMLQKTNQLDDSVLRGVLEHHERTDGSGYPFKLRAEKLHPFSNIIAVADIYDAMTSDRVYQKKRTPFSVVEELNIAMFDKLDPVVCTTFLNNVNDYFVGSIVRLSDGREAEVVYLGRYAASRPVVRTGDGEIVDLEAKKSISIEGLA